MVSEQLLNIANSLPLKLITKLLDTFMFYAQFTLQETSTTSIRNFFVWKSANFADSYWFLYNDKKSLHDNTMIK